MWQAGVRTFTCWETASQRLLQSQTGTSSGSDEVTEAQLKTSGLGEQIFLYATLPCGGILLGLVLGHLPERGQPQWGCSAWWQQHEATGAVSNRRPLPSAATVCCAGLHLATAHAGPQNRPFPPPSVSVAPAASSLTSR